MRTVHRQPNVSSYCHLMLKLYKSYQSTALRHIFLNLPIALFQLLPIFHFLPAMARLRVEHFECVSKINSNIWNQCCRVFIPKFVALEFSIENIQFGGWV